MQKQNIIIRRSINNHKIMATNSTWRLVNSRHMVNIDEAKRKFLENQIQSWNLASTRDMMNIQGYWYNTGVSVKSSEERTEIHMRMVLRKIFCPSDVQLSLWMMIIYLALLMCCLTLQYIKIFILGWHEHDSGIAQLHRWRYCI